jgi:hypothetical protein
LINEFTSEEYKKMDDVEYNGVLYSAGNRL